MRKLLFSLIALAAFVAGGVVASFVFFTATSVLQPRHQAAKSPLPVQAQSAPSVVPDPRAKIAREQNVILVNPAPDAQPQSAAKPSRPDRPMITADRDRREFSTSTQSGPEPIARPGDYNNQALGKATYNKPKALQIGRTTEVSVIVQVDPDQEIKDQVAFLPGLLTSAMIPVTNLMSARLSGDNEVTVTSLSAIEQAVTSRAPTQWRWHVKPSLAGKTILTLEIFGHYKFDETLRPVAVRVYRDEIQTTATWFEQAQQYISSFAPIQATVFAIGGLIGSAALWLVRRFRREPTGFS